VLISSNASGEVEPVLHANDPVHQALHRRSGDPAQVDLLGSSASGNELL